MKFRLSRGVPKVVIEDPEALGYRLGEEPLLAVLSADEWRALELAATTAAPEAA